MNRKQVPKGKLVRRLGINLFDQPKYDRLLKRKSSKPGLHAGKRGGKKGSEYSKQLIEKQKMKFAYGLSERQFRNIFERAKTMPGITGNNMLALLERRLDNVVYRAGFACTRAMARQIVGHGHIHLNGRVVNIPSTIIRPGDFIEVKPREHIQKLVREQLSRNNVKSKTTWIEVSEDQLNIKIERIPRRDEIPTIANEQMVVELYAK
jgi:small subunit ribosomal protein S4